MGCIFRPASLQHDRNHLQRPGTSGIPIHYLPTGTFDPLIFSLTSVSSLAFVQTGLIGSIPAQISQLIGLQMLQTSSNLLAGSLPPSLSLLRSLEVLEMNSNQLTGPIPPQLSTLTLV